MTQSLLTLARLKTVRDHMALECDHDWDAVINTFQHPRYEMHASGAVHDGEEEVRRYFAESRSTFPDLSNEIIAVAGADDSDTVLVEFWLRGTHLGVLRVNGKEYAPTGRRFETRMSATFEFAPDSEKIICERPYSSSDARLRALGLV